MRIHAALLLTLLVICAVHARAGAVTGDVVLIQTKGSAGRMSRWPVTIRRVGLVRAVNGESAVVQEINYPTRQGAAVYRKNSSGVEERYEGLHEVPLAELIPRTESAAPCPLAARHRLILTGRTRTPGYVVYAFARDSKYYVALTDSRGWACYQELGERCHEQMHVRLVVRSLSCD
ncbi:MAG TPA: hypothetical protein VFV50_06325 [Bdellovibrionales bacterium]|nr:hypothetical protein [Bdellovibrionales bacterium]